MDKKLKIAFFALLAFGLVSVSLLYLFSSSVIVLNPAGMIGEKERDLLLLSTYIMLLIVIPVLLLTFWIAWRYRATHKNPKYDPDWDNSHLAEALWWGIPLVIIIALSVITWKSCHDLNPFKPIASDQKPLKIQVIALEWKWLFLYPEQGIATVNYVEFPEKVPLEFEIASDAPMNSFWIPELGGQIYAMSGMRSKLYLIANKEGTYRGVSANISGQGFSGMTFQAKSVSAAAFDSWVASSQQSAGLTWDQYNQLVVPSSYNPPATYSLPERDLFEGIIDKYKKGTHARNP